MPKYTIGSRPPEKSGLAVLEYENTSAHLAGRIKPKKDVVMKPPPVKGGGMKSDERALDDAKLGTILDLIENGIGWVEAAKQILRRASPDDRARIASMAAAAVADGAELQMEIEQEAVEKWAERKLDNTENAAEFIRRVYRRWLDAGLTLPIIRRCDLPLYESYSVWIRRHPSDAIPLLKRTDVVSIKVQEVIAEKEINTSLGNVADFDLSAGKKKKKKKKLLEPARSRESERLRGALRRRDI